MDNQKTITLTILPGDGIGLEVMDAALLVLDAISKKKGFNFDLKYELAGGASIDKNGSPLTDSVLQTCYDSDAVLLGALGGPKWDDSPQDQKPEMGFLKLRKGLDLFANLRPAIPFDALLNASSLKKEVIKDTNIMIVRELAGGIYFGEPRSYGKKEAYNTLRYNRHEIERISKMAFELAKMRSGKVTSVDKANVLESSQFWRNQVRKIHSQYPDITLNDMLADNAAMQLVRDPRQFDVILTQNLFGDILSDITAMITGSLGMLPSASIGSKHAMYEPVHGTAPEIAGKNIANPIAMIASLSMMLEYTLKDAKTSQELDRSISQVLNEGMRTQDIAQAGDNVLKTYEMAQAIIDVFLSFS